MAFDMDDMKKRMNSALDALAKEFSGLRTGRASTSLLDQVMPEAYGQKMPLSQLGTVSAPEARMLSVQVWDKSMVKAVEKAILEAGLGLNPVVDGQLIRIPMPPLSQERRQELCKVAAKYAEQAKIAVRNVRRDAMEAVKKMKTDSEISEDDMHRFSDDIQKQTDDFIAKIDQHLTAKEKDIMQV